ncbi:MAG: TatD family hydrolase, partial [bacterium]
MELPNFRKGDRRFSSFLLVISTVTFGFMFFDTHVHFDLLDDVDGVIARAVAAGVGKMAAVGGSQRGNEMAVELARKNPGGIIATAGFDREHAGKTIDLVEFESFARSN